MKSRFPYLFWALAALVILALAYLPVTAFLYAMKWDIMDQFYPYRILMSDIYHAGSFPYWNPYINFGYPYFADPQSATFYPITMFLCRIFQYDSHILHLEWFLHILIAVCGMYYLLRTVKLSKGTALLFGLTYAMSGIFVGNAQHLTWITSMAWLPWIFGAYLRLLFFKKWKYVFYTALFSSLCLLGGYPIFAIITAYLLALLFLYQLLNLLKSAMWYGLRRYLSMHVVLAICAGVLCLPYLSGFLSVKQLIVRGDSLSFAAACQNSFTLKSLLSLLFPFATNGNPKWFGTDIAMSNLYMGWFVLPLLVMFFFRRQKTISYFFLAIALFCLLAALGPVTPVRHFLFAHVPFMDMFRNGSLFRAFTVLGFLFCAATVWNDISDNKNRITALLIIFSLLFSSVFIYIRIWHHGVLPASIGIWTIYQYNENVSSIGSHIMTQALLQSVLCISMTLLWIWRKNLNLLALFFVFEMMLAVTLNSPGTIVSDIKYSEFNKKDNHLPRNFPIPANVPMNSYTHIGDGWLAPVWYNTSMYYKRMSFDGFNSFYQKSYDVFMSSNIRNEVLRHPLAYLANKDSVLSDGTHLLIDADSSGTVQCTAFAPNKMTFIVNAINSTQFVFLQSAFPGWIAILDDKEKAQITACNYNFMGIQIDKPGKHKVEFIYQPQSILWMACVSILGFAAILISSIFFRLRDN